MDYEYKIKELLEKRADIMARLTIIIPTPITPVI